MNDIAFLPGPPNLPGANIKVVGVGGAGCNALNRMIEDGVSGVEFIAMNTDMQSLAQCKAEVKIPLGPTSMRGLGVGGDAQNGAVAAEESRAEIVSCLMGADIVFIAAGMGGGTGTGAAPVVANCASEHGALAVAIVLTPCRWEGAGKNQKAAVGLKNLRNTADTVIVVSNEKVKEMCDKKTLPEVYKKADSVLIQGVRGISDLILRPGIINGDFADVKAVLQGSREALIGTGEGGGDEAILDAVKKALECPLLERDQHGVASKVIISVMADWDQVEYSALEKATNYLSEHYKGHPEIKLCPVEAPELKDHALVTVLASFDEFAEAETDLIQNSDIVGRPTVALPTPPYVKALTSAEPWTPDRLVPPQTPSGDIGEAARGDDYGIPSVWAQGRLLIEE